MFHRIIPLGLTLGEAKAWYVNHVLIPRLRYALAALTIGFIILSTLPTEVGQLLEQTLVTHMIVHDPLLLVAGFLLAFAVNSMIEVAPHLSEPFWQARNAWNGSTLGARALSMLTFGCAAVLVGYWYLPAQFSAAAASVSMDAEMGLAFLFAGGLIFVGACFLTRRTKLIALVIVGKALGLYGMFLLLIPRTLYPTYPSSEQVYAGTVLLFLMLILDFTIMPLWLYNYFGKRSVSLVAFDETKVV